MRVLLIHNPKAGSAEDETSELIGHITRAGHEVEYCPTQPAWVERLHEGPDLVAVMGGDGTVAQVAREMQERPIPIGLLPMGTANNIATSLGLTGMPFPDLIAGWAHATRQPFDIGVARGPWGTFRFLESVGAGLLSETMAAIDFGWASHVNEIEHTEERIGAALVVFREILLGMSSSHFEIRLDGRELSGAYLLVEALNFGAAGPNLQLARHANYSDGLLDLVLVEEHRRQLLGAELERFRSDPQQAPTLRVHRGRRLEVRCEQCLVHLDDELWKEDAAGVTIDVSLEPGALTFLVPPTPG
jgi:diacylglycerol kinase (ATP)